MKMKKRIISLVLCVLMIHSFSPAGLAAGSVSRTDIMYRNADVEEPKASSWLSVFEEKYVKTKGGVCAYLRYHPSPDSDSFDYVYEGDVVTVLAKQNGLSFVMTANGDIGWVTSSVLSTTYPGRPDLSTASTMVITSAAGSHIPGEEDLVNCDSTLVHPQKRSWLQTTEAKKVKTKGGICAYLRKSPSAETDNFGYVYEDDVVWAVAEENGYFLVISKNGDVGWVTSSILTSVSSATAVKADEITNQTGLVQPKSTSWLQYEETKIVKTVGGKYAYLRSAPKKESTSDNYVYEGETVTVLARENGFSYVRTLSGKYGWVTSSVLADSYDVHNHGSSSNDREVCRKCKGRKVCTYCLGSRIFYAGAGEFESCPFCYGSGLCWFCSGRGYTD